MKFRNFDLMFKLKVANTIWTFLYLPRRGLPPQQKKSTSQHLVPICLHTRVHAILYVAPAVKKG